MTQCFDKSLADPRGRAIGTCTPSLSNFFHFHAVFGKYLPKLRSWHSRVWKILDLPFIKCSGKDKIVFNIRSFCYKWYFFDILVFILKTLCTFSCRSRLTLSTLCSWHASINGVAPSALGLLRSVLETEGVSVLVDGAGMTSLDAMLLSQRALRYAGSSSTAAL